MIGSQEHGNKDAPAPEELVALLVKLGGAF